MAVVDPDTGPVGNDPESSSGLDGWVDVEDGVDIDVASDSSNSDTSAAAAGPRSVMGVSLPLGFSRILNEGWQGLNQRFSSG